jgi:hypothetical protein
MTAETEICNGVDDDCDGLTDEDVERGPEVCNGIDDDCDGLTDEDVERGPEVCNGIDDDCNGTIDEGVFGVVGGPWRLAWDSRGFGSMSAAWWPGGTGIVVGTSPSSDGWYRIVSLSEGILGGDDIPYDVNGCCTVRVGDELRLITFTPAVEWGDWESQKMLVHRVASDGTLGDPVEVGFDFLPVTYLSYACLAAPSGDGFILQPGPVENRLLHVSAAGVLLRTWDPAPSGSCLAPTADGSWMTVLEDDGGWRVLLRGPADDPFSGVVKSIDLGNVGGWLLSQEVSWCPPNLGPVSSDAGRFAVRAYTPDTYGRPYGEPPWGYRMVEFGDEGGRFVLDDLRVVPTHARPALAATELGTYVVFGKVPLGPDRPDADAFWHVADMGRLATAIASPTGTFALDGGPVTHSWQLEPTLLGGGRVAFSLWVGEDSGEALNVVVLGCLPAE